MPSNTINGSVVFLLFHGACVAAQVSALVVLFSFGLYKSEEDAGTWLVPAVSLLLLQLLISFVCCLATWNDMKTWQISKPRPPGATFQLATKETNPGGFGC
eukprot:Skav201498  [mRNA]  locus=scaffold1154:66933:74445:+ [translate_table: standard]